jgi:hypothetical protein
MINNGIALLGRYVLEQSRKNPLLKKESSSDD